MEKRILISWIGFTDLRAPAEFELVGIGPVAQAAETYRFDEIVLLNNYPEKDVSHYIEWLKPRTDGKIFLHFHKLSSPTNFGEIYEAAVETVNTTLKRRKQDWNSPSTLAQAPRQWQLYGSSLQKRVSLPN